MKNVQVINQLFTQTAHACHVELRPISLLVAGDSVTYLGGEKVRPTEQYPTRAQFLRRQQLIAMVEEQSAPAHTMGDFEEMTHA